jgi:aromatic-L-amino-acid decarboxylase
LRPWLVVAAAGTTDTGAVDPLADIGAIAASEGLWFHVDAAYGGAFALCEPGRRRLVGIEQSDSMVMDPHKGLFVPFGTGVVLVKDRQAMVRSHAYDAAYMQDAMATDVLPSPADVSPELTRPNRVLRVWLPLRLHGVAAFRAALEEKLLLAEHLHTGLGRIPQIEVGPEPDLSVVTFRCRGRDGDTDAATRRLHQALTEDGRIFVSSTQIHGSYTLRMAVLNIRTHREHIDRAVSVIGDLAPSAV